MADFIPLEELPEDITPEEIEIARANRKARKASESASSNAKQAKYWQHRCELLEDQLDVALALHSHQPVSEPIEPVKGKKTSESVACMVLSDWHVEETVEARTINGMNEYNLDVAKDRLRKVWSKSHSLVNMMRSDTRISNLVVMLLGDHMTGYIHEELIEGNALSPTETSLWLIDNITDGLDKLLADRKFSKITVCCCVGNHGRTTKKPRVATGYKNSYEWQMFHMIARIYREKSARIEFQIADGYHLWREIFGQQVRMHHGDAIRYQGGVGGITIPVNKAIDSWNKGRVADLDIFGHWHQLIDCRHWLCNGSVIGYNAYALKIKARYEPPAQQFFLIEKELGRTITAPILLG